MTYSWSAISGSDSRLLALAADAPFFLARNILEVSKAGQLPRWNTTGSWADPDIAVPGYYGYKAVDGLFSAVTMPALTASANMYLLFNQFPSYQAQLNSADMLYLWLSNLTDILGAGINITFQIANDNLFTNGLTTVATWNGVPGAAGALFTPNWIFNGRAYCWNLAFNDGMTAASPVNYLGVQFARLWFSGPANIFNSHQPMINEIFFGPRLQLTRKPDWPIEDLLKSFETVTGVYEPISGQRNDLVYNRERLAPRPIWNPVVIGLDPAYGGQIDNSAQLETAYHHSNGGTSPFIFVPSPVIRPAWNPVFKLDNPLFGIQRPNGPYAGSLNGQLWKEQPPNVYAEQALPFVNGASLNFTANNHFARVASPVGLAQGASQATWSCWFRRQGVPVASVLANLFREADIASAFPAAIVSLVVSGAAFTRLDLNIQATGGSGSQYQANFPVSLDTNWHHLCVTWLGGSAITARCEMYLDGGALTTNLVAGVAIAVIDSGHGNSFVIGGDDTGNSNHVIQPSHLDECFFANQHYSAAQVLQWLWNNGHPGDLHGAPGAVSWWNWENTAADVFGVNNATLNNALSYTADHP